MSYPAPSAEAGTDQYTSVQRFYADQMQLLDDGDTDAWAATFTDDGVFAGNGLPQAVRGRSAIAAAAQAAARQLAAAGRRHRHWIGMLTVRPDEDGGTVRARSYALVIEVTAGAAEIHRSTVCEDVLVPAERGWLVRERYVTRDDLA